MLPFSSAYSSMLNVCTCLQEMFNWLIIWASKAYCGFGAAKNDHVSAALLQALLDAAENVEQILQSELRVVLDNADLQLWVRMLAEIFAADLHDPLADFDVGERMDGGRGIGETWTSS